MGNRRVEFLTYRLETDDTVSFDADPVEYETDAFSLRLEEDKLTIDLHEHFSSVDAAREQVEPFLESWEIRHGLRFGQREINFNYKAANVAREGDESDNIAVVGAEIEIDLSAEISHHKIASEYPAPPGKFRLSPNARTLWNRYEGYEGGREPVFSMGYACLEFLEGRAGGREEAAMRYNIEYEVLDNLGRLTSTLGGPEVARKPASSQREATPEEKRWIEKTVRQIIHQVGISDAGHDPETLTKDDLPPLP